MATFKNWEILLHTISHTCGAIKLPWGTAIIQKPIHKIFHSSTKLIANDSVIDKEFGSMHQSVMIKTKNSVGQNWILKTILEDGVEIFEC